MEAKVDETEGKDGSALDETVELEFRIGKEDVELTFCVFGSETFEFKFKLLTGTEVWADKLAGVLLVDTPFDTLGLDAI